MMPMLMASEVEERPRLVTAGYDPHRSQRVNGDSVNWTNLSIVLNIRQY